MNDLKEYFFRYNKNSELLDIITIGKFKKLKQLSSSVYIYNGIEIKLTRTSKVVMKDKCRCVSCGVKATHVIICKESGSPVYSPRFFGYSNELESWVMFTKDHILPASEDGRNGFNNLQSMCYVCNQEKASDHDVNPEDLHKLSKANIHSHNYLQNQERIKDFKKTRVRLRKLIKNMPWYYKILGVHKLIEKRIMLPLAERGYSNEKSDE